METNASSSAGKLNLWRNKKKMQFSVIGKLIAKPPATITQFELVVGLVYIMHVDVGLKLWYPGVNKCRWPTANFFIGHFITREEIQLSLLPLSAILATVFMAQISDKRN